MTCKYCEPDQEYCGPCEVCGKPGHLKSIEFYSGIYCDKCEDEAFEVENGQRDEEEMS